MRNDLVQINKSEGRMIYWYTAYFLSVQNIETLNMVLIICNSLKLEETETILTIDGYYTPKNEEDHSSK